MRNINRFNRPIPFSQLNKGYNIDLPNEITKVIPAKEVKITKLEVYSVIDEPSSKKVTANLNGFGKVVLWEGAAYDAIGQWTDDDVKNRLIEIYSK